MIHPDNSDLELTILMPCLNEAETIASCVQKAINFINQNKIEGEVLVADNGSVDGSRHLALENGARVVDVVERGYGRALITGSRSARGRFIIMGDADSSYDFSALKPILDKLREGYELVMGNRFLGGIQEGAMPWKNRYLGNPVLSGLGKLFFRTPIGDFHCGLRGYTKKAFVSMNLVTPGMEFASEMVIKASLAGFKISEVPIKLYPDGRSRAPHLRPWRDGWRHLHFMLMLSPRWLFLYPGSVLMFFGSLVSAFLFFRPINFFGVTFDVHSLLVASSAILVGFQMFSLALLLRQYSIKSGLIKRDSWDLFFQRFFSLESGIVISALLAGFGLFCFVISILGWKAVGFGNILDLSSSFREIIPAVLCFCLGLQIFLTSCALSAIEFLGSCRSE